MPVFEIKAAIPRDAIDEVESMLLEHQDPRWSVGEDLLTNTAWVAGLFENKSEALEEWNVLSPMMAIAEPVVVREVEDTDWRESYKAHFKPWSIGRLHWVPVWERETYALPDGDEVVWLDPGMAFGTGNHETTRLCVERLARLAENGGDGISVLDAGCGSGILAISAVKLGFGGVAGFDNDPEAVRIARENSELNGTAGAIEFYEGDLVSGLEGRAADVVLANILANVLTEFAPQLIAAVNPGGTLVLSGILANEAEEVRRVFLEAAPGWHADSRVLGEWADVQLCRPMDA